MAKKNPTKPVEEITPEKADWPVPEIETPKPVIKAEESKPKRNVAVVKCHLRKIGFTDTLNWPEKLRGIEWLEGEVKEIPKETYEILKSFYPNKFELIREG